MNKNMLSLIQEEKPMPDEIEAIQRANENIKGNGTVPHSAIDWD